MLTETDFTAEEWNVIGTPPEQKEDDLMNPLVISAREPIIVGAVDVALIEGAARDLEHFSEERTTRGHFPSWTYAQVPEGWALCVGCWRPIVVQQLGGERCPGIQQPAASQSLPSRSVALS